MLICAAGSSNGRALADARRAASILGKRCGQRLSPSYVTVARPQTAELCALASLVSRSVLAGVGTFPHILAELPVTATAAPVGEHPRVIDLIVQRYAAARANERTVA